MKVHIYVALGITIGLLAGVLCLICDLFGTFGVPALAIAAWPGFISWACYFAIGGKPSGMGKVIAANTAGIIVAGIILALTGLFGGSNIALAIAVVIGAFLLCVEAFWTPLSFIPGAFCGCACAFGFGASFGNVNAMIALAISMCFGALLAYVSDIWAQTMTKK